MGRVPGCQERHAGTIFVPLASTVSNGEAGQSEEDEGYCTSSKPAAPGCFCRCCIETVLIMNPYGHSRVSLASKRWVNANIDEGCKALPVQKRCDHGSCCKNSHEAASFDCWFALHLVSSKPDIASFSMCEPSMDRSTVELVHRVRLQHCRWMIGSGP